MLYINTRIVDSSEALLAKSAKVVAEGQAMVYVPGEVGVAPSQGTAGEIFAGFATRRQSAAPYIEPYAVKVEQFVIEAPAEGDASVQLVFEPVDNTVCVINKATGEVIASPTVEGKVVSSSAFKQDMEVEVVYKHELNAVQARAMFGDVQPGGPAGDQFGQTGLAKRGIIYTSWFDTSKNWAAAKQIKLAAEGMITNEEGAGEVLPGAYVVHAPSADVPFLGLEFSAA